MVANGSAAAVSATHVSFRHKGASAGYALDDLELEVPAGEVVVLCGRSGCGKTTVTRLLNGLIPQFYEGDLWGRADVLGVDPSVEPITRLATLVGSVFQNPRSQFFNVDTTSELAFGCENMGWAPTLIDAAMAGVVVRFGLEDLLDRNLFKLSGGEKQKIACASVSAHDPQLLVLDEPASNLDVASIRMLASIVAQWKAEGRTVVVAEHRLYFLTDLIDRAFYLRSGGLERVFTGEQFRSLPDPEREALGLRTLTPAVCTLPAVESAGSEEGLSVEGLTCSFRKGAPVFRDLSFSARPGEVVAITGPNGVGKTTLSRCLCGLLKEQAGQILLNGKPLDRKGRQRSAFCVMQDVNHQLFSDSVWGECRMSAPEASDNQISEVLDSLHLLSFRERHPMSLSGGQKQRLAVATALLSEKPVLIFDEPTSGLDYARMVEVSGVIRSLARHGRIVLVVTHDQEFMQRACDRVLRL